MPQPDKRYVPGSVPTSLPFICLLTGHLLCLAVLQLAVHQPGPAGRRPSAFGLGRYQSSCLSFDLAEFTSNAILAWQQEHDVEWHYIAPGKPTQNGFVESFKFQALPVPRAVEELKKWVFDEPADQIKNAAGQPVGLSKSAFVATIFDNEPLSAGFDRSAFRAVFDMIRMIAAPVTAVTGLATATGPAPGGSAAS
jgi:hypothetical protein